MENLKIESRYQKLCLRVKAFILQTRLSKVLNVSVDQKTRMRICFKTWSRSFEMLSRAFETLGWAFETLGRGYECLKEN